MRIARAASTAFHPVTIATALLGALALAHHALFVPALLSWLLLTVLPGALLVWGMRRGIWADADVSRLKERRTFLPWLSLAAGLAAALGFILRYPDGLPTALLGTFLWLAAATLVSLSWKISLHAAAAVGSVGIVAILFGGRAAMWLLWCPAAVAWSRLVLRRHTLPQVIAGACLGAAAAAAARLMLG